MEKAGPKGATGDGFVLFFRSQSTRLDTGINGWSGGGNTGDIAAMSTGAWKHMVVTRNPAEVGTTSVYLDDELKGSASDETLKFGNLTTLDYAYLSRSAFWNNGDEPLTNSRYYNFSIYEGPLTQAEIAELKAASLDTLNTPVAQQALTDTVNYVTSILGDPGCPVVSNLLTSGTSTSISYSSSAEDAITTAGVVTRPDGTGSTAVTLAATFTSPALSTIQPVQKTYSVRVMGTTASNEDFLTVHYAVNDSGTLVNVASVTKDSDGYFTPGLEGTAAVIANTVTSGTITGTGTVKAIDTGSAGYINLGSKVGALLRKDEWTIEFYMWSPSGTIGQMFAFGNDETIEGTSAGLYRGSIAFENGSLNFSAYTAGRSGVTEIGNSGGITNADKTTGFMHMALVKKGNNVFIFRNGDIAQNNRDRDFSILASNPAFGSGTQMWKTSVTASWAGITTPPLPLPWRI
jgi:hypothetical protein